MVEVKKKPSRRPLDRNHWEFRWLLSPVEKRGSPGAAISQSWLSLLTLGRWLLVVLDAGMVE
jgi:hypothetical protein